MPKIVKRSCLPICKHVVVALYALYSAWWLFLTLFVEEGHPSRDWFVDSYAIIAMLGGIIGLKIANKWVGFKSHVGKALVFFSLGLLGQFLGQASYTLQFYIHGIENAYPSYGEIFFLSSIPLYVAGVAFIGKAAGSGISLKNIEKKLIAIFIPLMMLATSYFLFLKGYETGGEIDLTVILDFAYPIGQAIFVSAAILAMYLSERSLGGVMKKPVLFILFSLVFQYLADTLFLYTMINDTWVTTDISDLLFLTSYFLMSIALISYDTAFNKIWAKD